MSMGCFLTLRSGANPASNTAARVSLPLTMSNIHGQWARNPKALTRLSAASVTRHENRPRLRRGGGISPDLFPVNHLFSPNPQAFRPQILAENASPSDPLGWIRKAIAAVGRKGPYTPRTLGLQHHFSRKCVKKEFSTAHIRRVRERVRKTPEKPLFSGLWTRFVRAGCRSGWPRLRPLLPQFATSPGRR